MARNITKDLLNALQALEELNEMVEEFTKEPKEELTEGMCFEEAMKALREGSRVMRYSLSFGDDTLWIEMVDEGKGTPYLWCVNEETEEEFPFVPSFHDLFATDWYIVPEREE